MKKGLILVTLSILVALVMALAGCTEPADEGTTSTSETSAAGTEAATETAEATPEATEEAINWLTPYEETVTVSIGRGSGGTFPEGDSLEDNAYTDWILEQFNIEVEMAWEMASGDDYKQKVSLVIASQDLPDIMYVGDESQVMQIIQSGSTLCADLTDAINNYSSPLMQAIYDSIGGMDRLFKPCKGEDGGIYAFPSQRSGYQVSFFWIRADWLEALDMEEPQTMDEVVDAARAFVEADMAGDGNTIGFALSNKVAGTQSINQADPVFVCYNSYPKAWYTDDSGEYIYGTLTEETKQALEVLASWYEEGLIDPEFATADADANIAAGYVGIVFGPWWTGGSSALANNKANDPDAEWIPVWIPDDEGTYNLYDARLSNTWAVVDKDYAYPEVLVKLLNLGADTQNLYGSLEYDDFESDIPIEVSTAYVDVDTLNWTAWPVNVAQRYGDGLARLYKVWQGELVKADAGEEIIGFATESFDAELIIAYRDGEDNSSAGLHVWTKTLALNLFYDHLSSVNILQNNIYPATTDLMAQKWSNLEDLEGSMLIKIIMGEEPLDYFDTFVADWLAQGGQEIIDEVNENYE